MGSGYIVYMSYSSNDLYFHTLYHILYTSFQKCKQCHAQLAIGGKPTAKVSLRKVHGSCS